ncbi:MAG: hypothetical protein II897_08160 [Clostridia bacterium]|nr:hypothetical protein [Clostridia bacterium]
MKRRIVCAICILAFLLCGCVPTPEKEYVVNKGDDKAGEAIEATAAPSEAVIQPVFPGHWEDDIKTDKGEMVIDADIITAGQEKYPVHLVGRHKFSSEEMARAANAFFTEMTGYQKGCGFTAEDCERALKVVAGSGLPDESKKVQMDWLEDLLLGAVVRDEGYTDADSFTEESFGGDSRFDYVIRQSGGLTGQIAFTGSELAMSRCMYSNPQLKTEVERWGSMYEGEKNAVVIAAISLEQAIAEAQAFLKEIGAEGFVPAEYEQARLLNSSTLELMSTGWEIKLVRSFGYAAVNSFENDAAKDPIGRVAGDTEFSYAWKCEWIDIYVSENGVEFFDWLGPLEDKGIANENVQLMEFDELTKIIKRYFTANLSDPDFWSPLYFRIDEMTLTVLPTGKKDSSDAYMMPAWVCVIGLYHSAEDEGYSAFYFPGEQQLASRSTVAFNAIDGTRVVVPQSR